MTIEKGGTIYQTQELVLAASGGSQQLIGEVAYVTVLSATYKDDIQISFSGGAFFPIPPGVAISGFMSNVWIKNANASANTVLVASGAAELRDNRLIIDSLNPISVSITGTSAVGGAVAHDAVASGNPFQQAAEARATERAAVSAGGDVARLVCDMVGKLIVLPYSNPENQWSYAAASGGILNTTTAVTVKAAGAGVLRNYITAVQISAEALTNATEVAIRDGAGGTVLWRIKVPIGGLPATTFNFPTPLKGTAATLLEVLTITASGAGAVYVNLQGYTGA